MSDQTLESFVKEKLATPNQKPTSWVENGKIFDGVSDEPWDAEDLAAEAVGQGYGFGLAWDEIVAQVQTIMESADVQSTK